MNLIGKLANRHTRAINDKVIRLIYFLCWRFHDGHWRRVHSRCYNTTQTAIDLLKPAICCKFYETSNKRYTYVTTVRPHFGLFFSGHSVVTMNR